MFQEKVTQLKKELVEYSGLIEKMVQAGMQGLVNKDKNVLQDIMQTLEPRANQYEIEIDEMCTNLIAQFEPKAKNLRTILMILKMNSDLERMGDHVVNIAQSAMYLIERPQIKPLLDLPRMNELTYQMLRDAISAFINEDSKLGKSVCLRDDDVDNLRDQILRELITYITSDPGTTERALHLISIARNLERIADLATNIGEEVMYMVEGRVIKHHHED